MNLVENVKEHIGVLTQFILDNLNAPVTPEVQVEFEVRFEQYEDAVLQMKLSGVSPKEAKVISPVRIPDGMTDSFEEWFLDRVNHMRKKELVVHKTSSNN